jgi:GTP-binding protein
MALNNPVVAIVGRANVGKSSLFNRLVGMRRSITHETAGTTRDAISGIVSWGAHHFWLVDTAGLKPSENELETHIQEQITEVATSADVIILTVDAGVMITNEDRQAAKLALKTGKPVILALNKIDTAAKGPADTFERLGIKTMVGTSAIHGQGTGDLLDEVIKYLKPMESPEEDNTLRLAILGRPNVGKSSLLNSLAGKQQALVSDIAGTTRDVNVISTKFHGRPVEFSDTAGLRRRGKIEGGIEKFSSLRTISAIAASDVCLLIIDATEPSAAQDQHIAGMVEEAGKG